MRLEFADTIMIFVVLKGRLLQHTETETSFVLIIFCGLVTKTVTVVHGLT